MRRGRKLKGIETLTRQAERALRRLLWGAVALFVAQAALLLLGVWLVQHMIQRGGLWLSP